MIFDGVPLQFSRNGYTLVPISTDVDDMSGLFKGMFLNIKSSSRCDIYLI